ncbi:MAG TPA: TIM barrel protein [Vicinamibacterales bacterium]|nr:TIM barrel protein [Vicinamibacterales bacterium]
MTRPMPHLNIANAPCSWGVLEFEEQSAAGYDYSRVLDEMRAAGYDGTELGDWGFMPTDPPQLRAALSERSLALLGAFVPVRLADNGSRDEGERAAIRTALLLKETGFPDAFVVLADDIAASPERTAVAGRVGPDHRLPEDGRATFAANAEGIARAVRETTGLRTVFHHHCASYIETPEEISDLMRRTDPGVLGLCLDTGHLTYAGGDPEAAVAEFGSRIWHLHLKDCSQEVAARARQEQWDYHNAVRNGVFCELGQGTVNFRAVLDALAARKFSGWAVVEQDVLPSLGTPAASAARNREFIRTLGF